MKPKDFRAIAKAMQEYGISRVKMGDVEVERPIAMRDRCEIDAKEDSAFVPPNAPVKESDPVEHKIEQMTSLLKLGDNELVDQLFPDHTTPTDWPNEPEEASA